MVSNKISGLIKKFGIFTSSAVFAIAAPMNCFFADIVDYYEEKSAIREVIKTDFAGASEWDKNIVRENLESMKHRGKDNKEKESIPVLDYSSKYQIENIQEAKFVLENLVNQFCINGRIIGDKMYCKRYTCKYTNKKGPLYCNHFIETTPSEIKLEEIKFTIFITTTFKNSKIGEGKNGLIGVLYGKDNNYAYFWGSPKNSSERNYELAKELAYVLQAYPILLKVDKVESDKK
jgi:hypothetical protein